MDFLQYLVLKLCSIFPIYTLVSFMHCKHCHNTVLAKDYLELKDESTDYNINIGPFSNEQTLRMGTPVGAICVDQKNSPS